MRRVVFTFLIIVALLLAALDSYLWVDSLVQSIYGYRSPLKNAPSLSAEATRPLTRQVVLVLVDGLRYDTSLQMAYLSYLRQHGAHAKLLANPPTTTQTAWVTLISGAGPEINNMPLFERPADLLQPLAADHVLAAARRVGQSTGIAGSIAWGKLVPATSLDLRYFVQGRDDAADRLVVDRALSFMEEFHPNLLLVHLQQMQTAGETAGAAGVEYRQAADRCDALIHLLTEALDPQSAVLIVASTHGLLDSGGYGGSEAVVTTTPIVIFGQSISAGDYGTLSQTDVAPIVATLLGAPVPAAAQGQAPTHMLRMEIEDKAAKLLALARQRLRVGDIYLYSIGRGTLSQTAKGDALVAESSMMVKSYDSAAELSALSRQQADREMTLGRRSRIWAERLLRAPFVVAAVLVPLWWLYAKRSKRQFWLALAALSAAAVYHALFLREGGAYSFSAIPAGGLAATLRPSIRRAAITLGAGGFLVVLWMWHERQRSIFQVIKSTYVYALLHLYCIGLGIAVCTWWSGPRLAWYIPNLTITYAQFTLLMQAMGTAAEAVVLPIPVVLLQRVLLALSDWRSRSKGQGSRASAERRPWS